MKIFLIILFVYAYLIYTRISRPNKLSNTEIINNERKIKLIKNLKKFKKFFEILQEEKENECETEINNANLIIENDQIKYVSDLNNVVNEDENYKIEDQKEKEYIIEEEEEIQKNMFII